MDSEKLIEEIKKFPVLYDQSHEKYKNAEYKERVWRAISVKIEGEVDECKKKWASIRDQLRRTLQKRKVKSGQFTAKIRKYKYEDNLTFLLPHLRDVENSINVLQIDDEDEIDLKDGNQTPDIFTQETYQEENLSEEEKNLPDTLPITSIWLEDSSTLKPNQVSTKKDKIGPLKPNKRKMSDREATSDSPASHLMTYILAEKNADKERKLSLQTSKQHPVDAFLGGIAPTLKSLDAILLNEAKGKIFSIVQELELRQLQHTARAHEGYFKYEYIKSPTLSPTQSPRSSTASGVVTADETNSNSFSTQLL